MPGWYRLIAELVGHAILAVALLGVGLSLLHAITDEARIFFIRRRNHSKRRSE